MSKSSLTRIGLITGLVFCCVVARDNSAVAQDWPSKAITAISPFGPGTSLEAAARPVFEEMVRELRQPIVIEHRPGAGSTTGTGAVASTRHLK